MKSYSKLNHKGMVDRIFHPRQEAKKPQPESVKNLDIVIDDDTVLGSRLYLHNDQSPIILYFHGNGETVSDYDLIAPRYNQAGVNIIITTYRGYGWSTGKPTVQNMIDDCKPILKSCQQTCEKYNLSGPLFIMGRSIGSVPAIELAYQYTDTFKGLIIESGFADTLPLLTNIGINPSDYSLQEEDGFGNREKIASITIPTLILHGAIDTIIPVPQAERLQAFSGARTKKFFVVPGADHNNVISAGGEHYFTTIKGFIDDVTGQTSWRNKRKKYKKTEIIDK